MAHLEYFLRVLSFAHFFRHFLREFYQVLGYVSQLFDLQLYFSLHRF
jgi:hypothetical protein